MPLEDVPPRAEQGAAVAAPRRRRRGDVLPAHHPALRARARHAQRRRSRSQDLPEAFDAKMRDYLGLAAARRLPRRAPGRPLVGHELRLLPDLRARERRLGAAVGARTADLGDLDEQFERGDFAPLREWLREQRAPARPGVHAAGAAAARDGRRAWTPRRTSATSSGSSGSSSAPQSPKAARLSASWQRQTRSPSVLRSYVRPQRAHVGGRMRALTSSARIRVAQRST